MRSCQWVPGAVLSLGLLGVPCAFAQDRFFAQDKYLHFTGSMVLGAGVARYSGSPVAGFWTAVGVGVLKEAYDFRHPDRHTASFKDLAWDAMGAYLGAQGTGVYLARRGEEAVVVYTRRF